MSMTFWSGVAAAPFILGLLLTAAVGVKMIYDHHRSGPKS